MKIGVYSDSYPDKRMILHKVPECQYVQIQNKREIYSRLLRLSGKNLERIRQTDFYAREVHFTLDAPRYDDIDLIHTFNRVCLHNRNRWVATFEKTFPEYFSDENQINYKAMRRQLPLILSENCSAILPMSNWAFEYELWFLSQFATTEEINTIKEKMRVLYPPQEAFSDEIEIRKKYSDLSRIRFFFVGSQMKRKGGVELLLALKTLRQEYDNFSLMLVGNIDHEYAKFCLTEQEKSALKNLISESEWLDYRPRVENEEVLKFAKEAHVGVLPTLGDTFGFSVLEMQACGCPVITTDRQAIPEINGDGCGWIVHADAAELSHGDDFAHYTTEEVTSLSRTVEANLIAVIRNILDHPETIEQKAILALERIKKQHSPIQYAAQLRECYMNTAGS